MFLYLLDLLLIIMIIALSLKYIMQQQLTMKSQFIRILSLVLSQ